MYAITGSGFQIATIVLCSQALLASALHENVTNQIVLVIQNYDKKITVALY